MKSESLDRIASSDDAVFAIDRTDRIIVWNRACERLMGLPAPAVLGRFCFEVLGGRDLHGNVHCYENCPVIHQIRAMPEEPLRRFSMRVRTASGQPSILSVSAFMFDADDPSLGVIVHVLKEEGENFSDLERRLHLLSATAPIAAFGGWPRTMEDLTAREREVLGCLARGMSTGAIATDLCIATVTVRNHVRNVLQKLGVHTRFAAVAYAYQNDVV